jgi:hypothetical protein
MDLVDLPEIKISDKKRSKNEADIRAFLQRCKKSVKGRIQELKNAGYSDDEIEMIYAF